MSVIKKANSLDFLSENSTKYSIRLKEDDYSNVYENKFSEHIYDKKSISNTTDSKQGIKTLKMLNPYFIFFL